MSKKLYLLIVNMLLFWVLATVIPGISSPDNRSIGYLISSLFFGFIILSLPTILRFFKFPVNFWGKFFIGTLLTLIMLAVFNFVLPGVLKFGEGQVGGTDLIIFTVPKLFKLPNALAVILFSSVFINVCSIILAKLSKGD